MAPEFIVKHSSYEGCTALWEEARIVLVGAGFDGTSSYRPGSRFAPTALRSQTILAQENYSPYFKKDLADCHIHDLGDVEIAFGNKEETLHRIETASQSVLERNKIPFFVGGEHLITLAAVKPFTRKYTDLCILQVDAHLDLIDELFGERYSHGTVMRRIWELLPDPGRIFQVGIRSGSPQEYEFAGKHTRLFEFNTRQFLTHVDELKNVPVYLTIDLDVFDPAVLPGTGTPEAGGIFFQEFIHFLKTIESLNIVGADMVELAPQIDPTNNSTITASKILRELLVVI